MYYISRLKDSMVNQELKNSKGDDQNCHVSCISIDSKIQWWTTNSRIVKDDHTESTEAACLLIYFILLTNSLQLLGDKIN